VDRKEADARVVVEQILRPVAVVDVPIDDENAVELKLVDGQLCRDGDVAQQAKSHRPVG